MAAFSVVSYLGVKTPIRLLGHSAPAGKVMHLDVGIILRPSSKAKISACIIQTVTVLVVYNHRRLISASRISYSKKQPPKRNRLVGKNIAIENTKRPSLEFGKVCYRNAKRRSVGCVQDRCEFHAKSRTTKDPFVKHGAFLCLHRSLHRPWGDWARLTDTGAPTPNLTLNSGSCLPEQA